MTDIVKKPITCTKCGNQYEVLEVLSMSSVLPHPDLGKLREDNKCPKCGNPYPHPQDSDFIKI